VEALWARHTLVAGIPTAQVHRPMKSQILRLTANVLVLSAMSASAAIRYVDVNRGSPTPPYTDWTTAATTIRLQNTKGRVIYGAGRRIGEMRDVWSAPAKRSGDGALTVLEPCPERAKAGSRFACPRTPNTPAPQLNVAHPTVR